MASSNIRSIQLPLRGQKRKARSDEDIEIERISFQPKPGRHQLSSSEHGKHKRRLRYMPKKANSVPTFSHDTPPLPISTLRHSGLDDESSRTSNLDVYLAMLDTLNSSESVGPQERALKAVNNIYDPLIFSDDMPSNVTPLAPILFQPRPPPALPQHILDLPFNKVIRRYNNLAFIVDNYLRWHGLTVFGWWTEHDLKLAASGENPAFTEALAERPAIPPNVLQTPFSTVLLCAPVLSHVIERYHNDLGYNYFGFYNVDHRVKLIESEANSDSDFSDSSDGRWESE